MFALKRLLCAALVLVFTSPLWAIDAGGRTNHGETITVDLPDSQHLRNRGGSDGLGLCVFAANTHAGRYQNEAVPMAIFEYMWSHPGGGYPEKLTMELQACAHQMGFPVPEYIQITNGDMAFLRLALKTGRYPCVTYNGRDGVFYNQSISHMVNLVHLSSGWAVIHDNNYPGKYLWMTPKEFQDRWTAGGGGWAVVYLGSPPPPVPTNSKGQIEMHTLVMAALMGQCSGGSCAIQPNFVQPVIEQTTGWYELQEKNWIGYWIEGRYIGKLNPGTSEWIAGKPGAKTYNLVEVFGFTKPEKNYGVVSERIGSYFAYECNGKQCTREEAIRSLVGDGLVDDSHKWFLTVVDSDKTKRKTVRDWLENDPSLQYWKGKLHINDYAPDNFHVEQVGLAMGITFQGPQDKSGRSVVEFRIPLTTASDLAAALRAKDPNYDPNKDVDPNKPKTPEPKTPDPKNPDPAKPNDDMVINLSKIPNFAWFAGAGLGLVYLSRKKQQQQGK